nr:MAG TPA: hypothetical protein [Caudoviricetes sp.]
MASTNKTTTLDLSQFVGNDKPDWLTDYNEDMEKIDTWATTTDSDVSDANNKATQAVNTANAASTAANSATTAANNAVTVANSVVNGWEAIVPTSVNSKITEFTRICRGNVPAGILFLSAYFYNNETTFSLNGNETLFKIPTKFVPTSSALYGAITLKDNTNNITISNLTINNDGSVNIWSGAGTISNIKELTINSIGVIPV